MQSRFETEFPEKLTFYGSGSGAVIEDGQLSKQGSRIEPGQGFALFGHFQDSIYKTKHATVDHSRPYDYL